MAENAVNHPGDHLFFIGVNDANRDPSGGSGNHPLVLRVSIFIEFDSKKSQPIANPGANRGSVLPDATSEHQHVQSAQRRRECTDPFLDLIAKQRDRLSRPHVLRLTVEQVTHVGTGLRNSEQAGLEIDHFVELFIAHFFSSRQIPNQSGINIA